MKFIIVGGGIAGLSTYLHLRKYLSSTHTIIIYESHPPRASTNPPLLHPNINTLSASTTLVGGGLGISPNGMRVLLDLSPNLHDAVVAQGFPAESFIFKGANGWTLGKQKTSDEAVKKEGHREEFCMASSRHGLWETLMQSVGEGIIKYRKVVGIEHQSQGNIKVRLVDSKGIEEEDVCDLLIGADGVMSVVRSAVFGEDKFKPTHTGQSGVGGFLRQPIPDFVARNKAMVFTFGGNGFFGYSSSAPISAESLMWWSTFETSDLPSSQNLDTASIKTDLQNRHKDWNDPIIQHITQTAEVQSIYPTWVVPALPHWGDKGIVLVGDAAHALDPTTGQGASQALEDSQTLALLLASMLKDGDSVQTENEEKACVALAIKIYHKIRSPRVHKIVRRGEKISGSKSNVNVVMEYAMYLFLWTIMQFPSLGKMMLGDVNRELYSWSAKDEIEKELQRLDSQA